MNAIYTETAADFINRCSIISQARGGSWQEAALYDFESECDFTKEVTIENAVEAWNMSPQDKLTIIEAFHG